MSFTIPPRSHGRAFEENLKATIKVNIPRELTEREKITDEIEDRIEVYEILKEAVTPEPDSISEVTLLSSFLDKEEACVYLTYKFSVFYDVSTEDQEIWTEEKELKDLEEKVSTPAYTSVEALS